MFPKFGETHTHMYERQTNTFVGANPFLLLRYNQRLCELPSLASPLASCSSRASKCRCKKGEGWSNREGMKEASSSLTPSLSAEQKQVAAVVKAPPLSLSPLNSEPAFSYVRTSSSSARREREKEKGSSTHSVQPRAREKGRDTIRYESPLRCTFAQGRNTTNYVWPIRT